MTSERAENIPDDSSANLLGSMFPNEDVKNPVTRMNFMRLWGVAGVLDHPRILAFIAIVEFSFAIMYTSNSNPFSILLWAAGGFVSYVGLKNFKRWRTFIDANFPPKTSISEVIAIRKKIIADIDNNSVR